MLTIWIICIVISLYSIFANRQTIFFIKEISFTLNTVFAIVVSFFILLLMTSNNIGYDADAFIRFFNYVKSFRINPYDYTYEALSQVEILVIGFFPSITYQQFHAMILFVTGGICIFPFFKRYAVDVLAVLSLYILSGVFASDGMQFKNFISVSFLIAAIGFDSDSEKSKWHYLAYYLMVCIATLFHFSFVIYAFLPLTRTKWFEKNGLFFPLIGGVAYFVFLFGGEFLSSAISFISQIGFLSKAEGYATQKAGLRSLVPFVIYFIILFVLNYLSDARVDPSDESDEAPSEMESSSVNKIISFQDNPQIADQISLAKNIYNIWKFMGLFLSLMCVANASYRLLRNLYIPVFTVIVNSISSIQDTKRRRQASIFSLVMAIIIFSYPILLGQHVDIYLPILSSNLFWE